MTYTLIDSVTLGSSASSVTFSGISATGKGDLVLVVEAVGSGGGINLNVNFNSDTGSNYPWVAMSGDAYGGAYSSSGTNTWVSGDSTDSTNKILSTFQIMDHSATDKHKSVLVRSSKYDQTKAWAARWANTSAITSVAISTNFNSFAAGGTFHLYQLVSE